MSIHVAFLYRFFLIVLLFFSLFSILLDSKKNIFKTILVSFLKLEPVPSYKDLKFGAFYEGNISLVNGKKIPLRMIFYPLML